MKKRFKQLVRGVVLIAAPVFSGGVAGAALVYEGGQLHGVDNLDVDGTAYDVRFVDGTCEDVYGDCRPGSTAFTFDRVGAASAADALFNELFAGPPAPGTVDGQPELMAGISDELVGQVYVLSNELLGGMNRYWVAVNNFGPGSEQHDGVVCVTAGAADCANRDFALNPGRDQSADATQVYARFSARTLDGPAGDEGGISAVPAPFGASLCLVMLAGLVCTRRLRKISR